jgi:2-methylcitrate dehydratase PrpD
MSRTSELAHFVAALRFEDLSPEVVQQAKNVLLDAVGCALGAFRDEPRRARVAVEGAMQFTSRSHSATVIGGEASHAAHAALAGGMLVNAADFDDTHKRALVHVGSVVIPAALAACEAANRNGRSLIESIVSGYEVAVRVGMAVMPSHYQYWQSTATNGTFGAAASGAKAMGLDAAGVETSFGFAGTQAAGLLTYFESGDDTKSFHPGKAAFNGLLGAMFAQIGATAPPDIFGHSKGYLAVYSDQPKPECLTQGLGTTWEILENGFKPYPSILASHSPIDAALTLRAKSGLRPEDIDSVAIHTYATVKSHFSNKNVTTPLAARLSVPYCVAAAIVDGEISQAQFTVKRFASKAIQDLLRDTDVVADAELNALYPEKFPARVVVKTKEGKRLEETQFYPKGDPKNPLSQAELEAKFRENARACLSQRQTERVLHMIEKIEHFNAGELAKLLGRSHMASRSGHATAAEEWN